MAKMAVVAHGGAGPGPERQANLQVAVDIASRLLLSGASAVEAAVEACAILEFSTPELEESSELMDQSF